MRSLDVSTQMIPAIQAGTASNSALAKMNPIASPKLLIKMDPTMLTNSDRATTELAIANITLPVRQRDSVPVFMADGKSVPFLFQVRRSKTNTMVITKAFANVMPFVTMPEDINKIARNGATSQSASIEPEMSNARK